MKRFLLIGGIGSGKSAVSHLFAKQGAFCLDLDYVGHAVLHQEETKAALCSAFGNEIIGPNQEIDHSILATRAFFNSESTALLNSITHPAIQAEAQCRLEQAEQEGYQLAIIEVSAFAGPDSSFMELIQPEGGIIAVVAPEAIRIERVLARGMLESDARARIAQQASDEERSGWADYIIENTGTLDDLKSQVASFMRFYCNHAPIVAQEIPKTDLRPCKV